MNELDTRGSHFYLALSWARTLAAQTKDTDLQAKFTLVAKELTDNESSIAQEMIQCQGQPVDLGGYYMPEFAKVSSAMRPSAIFNKVIDSL